jgi:hypothetical protein
MDVWSLRAEHIRNISSSLSAASIDRIGVVASWVGSAPAGWVAFIPMDKAVGRGGVSFPFGSFRSVLGMPVAEGDDNQPIWMNGWVDGWIRRILCMHRAACGPEGKQAGWNGQAAHARTRHAAGSGL